MQENIRIFMEGREIVGTLHFQKEGQRLVDFLNDSSEKFMVLTEAWTYDQSGKTVSHDNFLCLNKRMISVVKLA